MAVIRHVYLVDVVMVDVFHPPHKTYLLQNSVANTHDACVILIVIPILHPPPCSDLRMKSDLDIDTPNVVENIVSCAVLVVLEDDQHVGRL
jgi:hypothetical protein